MKTPEYIPWNPTSQEVQRIREWLRTQISMVDTPGTRIYYATNGGAPVVFVIRGSMYSSHRIPKWVLYGDNA